MGVTPALDIDGATAGAVARPASIEELCSILREADARRARVTPFGGGTHMQQGHPPERIDLAIDMTALAAVNEYEPDDLTISVQAGMRAATLTALLEEHGQFLPLDVEHPRRATLGGMIAVGHSGPRRFGFGSLRDLLIGVRVVLADGTLVKSGGMVVKNVSGYDLTRLYHGSLGSLGVIVDANFKCLSAPAQRTLLIADFGSPQHALQAGSALLRSALPFSGIAVTQAATLYVGCEGHLKDAARLRVEALGVMQGLGVKKVEEIHGSAGTGKHWSGISPTARGESEVVLRVNGPIAQMPELTLHVLELAARHDLVVAWTADLGCGVLDIGAGLKSGIPHPEPGIPRIERFQSALAQIADRARVVSGDPALRKGLSIFGPDPAGLPLMRLIKQQFDPNGILNAGRNVGGL